MARMAYIMHLCLYIMMWSRIRRHWFVDQTFWRGRDCYMDASKCITIRHKTNYIKGNYNNKTEIENKMEIDKKSGHFNYFLPVWPLNDLGVTLTWPWCYVYDSEQSSRVFDTRLGQRNTSYALLYIIFTTFWLCQWIFWPFEVNDL